MSETVFVEHAPAKINLTLEVLGRRVDGYHELDSLVAFARDAGDRIELRPGGAPEITVAGSFARAITGENIISRAVVALTRYGVRAGSIVLDKQLPIASGIGGGSADAAAVLRAARRAFPHMAGRVPWAEIAAELGADVTPCLEGRPLRIVGTGTHVEPVSALPELAVVLINPMAPVPADKTARVFRTLGLQAGASLRSPEAMQPLPHFAIAADLVAFIRQRQNGLTAAATAVVPAISSVIAALERHPDCRVARLSGAGPTCFGVFDTMDAAKAAAVALSASHPGWWVVPTRLG